MTHSFTVSDMTCGHCAGRITAALRKRDPAARVSIELTKQSVAVDGSAARDDYAQAIRAAGYTPAAAASS